MNRIRTQLVCFTAVFALLASLALTLDGRLFGHDFSSAPVPTPVETAGQDGLRVINTTGLCNDVTGYGGPVPVEIYITGDRVDSVHALPNSETAGFFRRLYDAGLNRSWNGRTVAEAQAMDVDAVSGATYSSSAFIANVRSGLAYDISRNGGRAAAAGHNDTPLKLIFAAVVIAAAAIIPLFWHNKTYRFVQQLLNVAILGFWGGTFLDYAMMVNLFSNGLSLTLASFVSLALFVIGFIYPLFGRYTYYCTNVCPMGALQDLAGRLCNKKLHITPTLLKVLEILRQSLWIVLLAGLWAGFFTAWIDNEIFSGFIVRNASPWVIGFGVVLIILSIFIPRPFCRFLCTTGVILRHSQNV